MGMGGNGNVESHSRTSLISCYTYGQAASMAVREELI